MNQNTNENSENRSNKTKKKKKIIFLILLMCAIGIVLGVFLYDGHLNNDPQQTMGNTTQNDRQKLIEPNSTNTEDGHVFINSEQKQDDYKTVVRHRVQPYAVFENGSDIGSIQLGTGPESNVLVQYEIFDTKTGESMYLSPSLKPGPITIEKANGDVVYNPETTINGAKLSKPYPKGEYKCNVVAKSYDMNTKLLVDSEEGYTYPMTIIIKN